MPIHTSCAECTLCCNDSRWSVSVGRTSSWVLRWVAVTLEAVDICRQLRRGNLIRGGGVYNHHSNLMKIVTREGCQLGVCSCKILQRSGNNRKSVGSGVCRHDNHQTCLFPCILYEIGPPRKHMKGRTCSCSWSPHRYSEVLSETLFHSRRRATPEP